MRPLARWGTLPLLATPFGTAWALGLGEIELHSALNQPFDAEIVLVSATPEELAGLNVSLAPLDQFQRSGLDRPAFLSALEFEIGRNDAGQDVITIRSNQSITEPFVTMLVQASWPRGRLTREYTVLLDPPLLLPEPPAPAVIQPAETRAPDSSVAGGPISRPTPPAPVSEPEPQPELRASNPPVQAPESAPSTDTAPPPRASAPSVEPAPRTVAAGPAANTEGSTYGPVQNAETLWGISTRYRPNGVTMNQMMLAVYRANPQAFSGNMNILRRGAILRIPPMSDLRATSAADATAEFRRQDAEWRTGRPQSPNQPQPQPEPEARLVLVPPADEPPTAALSAGAGADVAADAGLDSPGGRSSIDEQAEQNERLISVNDDALADLQNQLRAPNPDEAIELEPVVDTADGLDSEQLFVDDFGEDAAADGADATPLADSELEPPAPVADETPVEPEPAAAPPPASQVVTTQPGPSLLERILDIIMSPVVAIVGLIVILIPAFLFLRRRRQEVEDVTGQWEALEAELDEDEVDHAATTRLRHQAAEDDFVVVEEDPLGATDNLEADIAPEPPAAPPPPPEPPLSEQTMSSQTVINLDQADPIAEADFHMAYGLYDQAADLVSKALEADPDSRELKLKLLEVFFVWGNKESFLQAATSLRDEMGGSPDADWDKVIIMGKQICPEEALFAEARAAAGKVDLDLEGGDGDAGGLDLAFGEGDDESVDLDFGTMADNDIELETTGNQTGALDALFEDDSLAETGKREQLLDDDDENLLDIGERTSAGLEAALFETDSAGEETSPDVNLDDLAATQESPTVETPKGASVEDDDWAGITMESPTIETTGPGAETVESTGLHDADGSDAPTVETPTIETEMPATREFAAAAPDATAELDLDDLGLDSADIDDLPSDLGDLPAAEGAESDTREQPAIEADDDLLSATGVTQVLRGEDEDGEISHTSTAVLGDEEATMLAPGLDSTGIRTEVLDQPVEVPGSRSSQDDEGLDLNLDDLTQALKGSDTVEQPRASSFDTGMFDGGASNTPVDLDVGSDFRMDDEPTGTEEVSPLDPQTMTEVGTKLDLARAYIDMGDPDGAKSILEEVLSEGDSSQRQEAQSLIDALPA